MSGFIYIEKPRSSLVVTSIEMIFDEWNFNDLEEAAYRLRGAPMKGFLARIRAAADKLIITPVLGGGKMRTIIALQKRGAMRKPLVELRV